MPPLLPHERWMRGVGVVAILACGWGVSWMASAARVIAPKCAFHSVTGLPCAFCGVTRSVYAVLGGDWPRALELNPIGFGVLFLGILFGCIICIEAARGKSLLDWSACWKRSRRFLPWMLPLLAAWWMVQLHDAIRTPKAELMDYNNPVARRVAEWFGGPSVNEGRAKSD